MIPERTSIFRETALERLSSPEQLDQLMRITSPRSWMMLVTIAILLALALAWGFIGRVPTTTSGEGIIIRGGGTFSVQSAANGQIEDVAVRPGERVRVGQKVATLIAATSSTDVVSPYDAQVLELLVNKGDVVQAGSHLLNVEVLTGPRELVLYLPPAAGKQVRKGMEVHVSPSTASRDVYGYLLGTVSGVSLFPATEAGMLRLLDNPGLVRRFQQEVGDAPIQVNVALTPDPNTPSGYRWSSSRGPADPVTAGTLATAEIVLGQQRPISLVLPVFQ